MHADSLTPLPDEPVIRLRCGAAYLPAHTAEVSRATSNVKRGKSSMLERGHDLNLIHDWRVEIHREFGCFESHDQAVSSGSVESQ